MKFFSVCGLILSNNRGYSFFTGFVLLLLILSSCSSHPVGPPGKGIMKEQDFIDLLIDVHYFEGVYSVTGSIEAHVPSPESESVDFYHAIFERHGVTREIFENSLNYYSYDPVKLEVIYNKVVEELSRRLAEVEMEEPERPDASISSDLTAGPEFESIWELAENWDFPGPDTNRMIAFEIPTRGPGIYTFSAQIRLDSVDIAENPRVSLWFWHDDGTEDGARQNFRPLTLNKDGRLRQLTVSRNQLNTDPTLIRGRILDMTNPLDSGLRSASVRNIRLYYREQASSLN